MVVSIEVVNVCLGWICVFCVVFVMIGLSERVIFVVLILKIKIKIIIGVINIIDFGKCLIICDVMYIK